MRSSLSSSSLLLSTKFQHYHNHQKSKVLLLSATTIRNNNNNNNNNNVSMKIHTITTLSSAGAIAAACCCSLQLLPTSHAWISTSINKIATPPQQFSAFSSTSSSALKLSTLATPPSEQQDEKGKETSSTKTTSRQGGKVIADGTIVSQFEGGLTAVRLNDDIMGFIPSSPDNKDGNQDEQKEVQEQQAQSTTTVDTPPVHTTTTNKSNSNNSNNNSNSNSGDMQGKEVVFANGSKGVVVAHRPPVVFVYTTSGSGSSNNNDSNDSGDNTVKILDRMASVSIDPSSNDDGLVNWRSTNHDSTVAQRRAIFAPIPQLKDIALINNPMLTGITMFDALAPIGRGQNMLLTGHDLDEMRNYAMDFIRTQVRSSTTNTKCVYASTDASVTEEVVSKLKQYNIDRDVHVVSSSSSNDSNNIHDASKSAEAVSVAAAACAVGEIYALNEGMDALVIIDNIDLHKDLWDATTRVLVDIYGVDAVVKADREGGASSEMRAFYSSLVQRSGRYRENRGGGSVTILMLTSIPMTDAEIDDMSFDVSDFEHFPDKLKERIETLVGRNIPLTASTLRKLDIPIPTEGRRRLALQHVDDLISMSDGQIWLDERLEVEEGRCPPLDPQRSVTRIGIGADTNSRADAPALRRIADRLRLDLSQASNMDGADHTTKASQKQIQRKDALLLAMHQKSGSGGRRLSESCVALLAATEGYLDDVVSGPNPILAGMDEGEELMHNLMDHVLMVEAGTMLEIDNSLDLTDDSRTKLKNAIESFLDERE